MAIKKAKMITVTSAKGGTGKTTTVLNLAGILSLMKKKILILDLDLYTGAIAPSLNVEITTDLYRLINDMSTNKFDNIENYVCTYNPYIDILPAPKDPRLANKIDCKYLSLVIKKLSMKYDAILVDTNHTLDSINLLALDHSDYILYVITNDLIDIKNMKSILAIYKDMGNENYRIVLNESLDRNRSYFTDYDIKNIFDDPIHYHIPGTCYVKNIDKYVFDGKILTIEKSSKRAPYEQMVYDMMKEEEK